jgi:rhodanese-related sulfurtransferase
LNRFRLALVVLALLALAACGRTAAPPGSVAERRVPVAGGAYTNVSVARLQTMLTAKDFLLVNVHIPFEGNLPGHDRFIPYHEIGQHLAQLPADRDAKIVLYCRTGRMSAEAAETLVGLGYTNVWNLDGGMVAWEQAGLPLIDR